jgi:hypothetical protein
MIGRIAALAVTAGFGLASLCAVPAVAAPTYIKVCVSVDGVYGEVRPYDNDTGYVYRRLWRGECGSFYNGDESLRVRIPEQDYKRKYVIDGVMGNYSVCIDGPGNHNPDNRASTVYYKLEPTSAC